MVTHVTGEESPMVMEQNAPSGLIPRMPPHIVKTLYLRVHAVDNRVLTPEVLTAHSNPSIPAERHLPENAGAYPVRVVSPGRHTSPTVIRQFAGNTNLLFLNSGDDEEPMLLVLLRSIQGDTLLHTDEFNMGSSLFLVLVQQFLDFIIVKLAVLVLVQSYVVQPGVKHFANSVEVFANPIAIRQNLDPVSGENLANEFNARIEVRMQGVLPMPRNQDARVIPTLRNQFALTAEDILADEMQFALKPVRTAKETRAVATLNEFDLNRVRLVKSRVSVLLFLHLLPPYDDRLGLMEFMVLLPVDVPELILTIRELECFP
jgi:hypothetical protein